jgi:hypothetical protein
MLVGVRVRRHGRGRVLSFRAAHGARVVVRVGQRRVRRRVQACKAYDIALPRRGSITLSARTATHVEERRVPGS